MWMPARDRRSVLHRPDVPVLHQNRIPGDETIPCGKIPEYDVVNREQAGPAPARGFGASRIRAQRKFGHGKPVRRDVRGLNGSCA